MGVRVSVCMFVCLVHGGRTAPALVVDQAQTGEVLAIQHFILPATMTTSHQPSPYSASSFNLAPTLLLLICISGLPWMCFDTIILPIHATIALFEQAPDAEKTSLLVKARRLVTASRNTVVPSYLQSRVLAGLPLPRVVLTPVAAGSDENEEEKEQEGRRFHSMLAFVVEMEGGPENMGMPRDVFGWCWTCSCPRGTAAAQ